MYFYDLSHLYCCGRITDKRLDGGGVCFTAYFRINKEAEFRNSTFFSFPDSDSWSGIDSFSHHGKDWTDACGRPDIPLYHPFNLFLDACSGGSVQRRTRWSCFFIRPNLYFSDLHGHPCDILPDLLYLQENKKKIGSELIISREIGKSSPNRGLRILSRNRNPCKTLSFTGVCYKKVGGAGGIRTHGKILVLRFFSKEVLSTPQPPLRDVSREKINHILPL